MTIPVGRTHGKRLFKIKFFKTADNYKQSKDKSYAESQELHAGDVSERQAWYIFKHFTYMYYAELKLGGKKYFTVIELFAMHKP